MRVSLRGLSALIAAALIAGCSRGDAHVDRVRRGLSRAVIKAVSMTPRGGDKQKRRHDATVYVDGNPVAFIKFFELPPSLSPLKLPAGDTRKAPRFSVASYFEALGLDLAKVREAHFYGGRGRVAVVSGAEIAKKRDIFVFRFTAGERGNVRMEWPGRDELEMTGMQADIMSDIAVYVERTAPRFDLEKGRIVDDEGKPFAGIPFAPQERPGGTRIYLDGRLVSSIKRKTLPDSVVVPGTPEAGQTRFSLAKVLQIAGVDASKVRGIEAISKQEIVARIAGDEAKNTLGTAEFVMAKESKGLIELPTIRADAKIEALLLHSTSLPERGPMPEEDGSVMNHPTPRKSGKTEGTTAARAVQKPSVR